MRAVQFQRLRSAHGQRVLVSFIGKQLLHQFFHGVVQVLRFQQHTAGNQAQPIPARQIDTVFPALGDHAVSVRRGITRFCRRKG